MGAVLVLLAGSVGAGGEVRVQDIAHLQGQRTNKLMGFGLVVGLNGTGDGSKYAPTMRALMALHRRYESPVLDIEEIAANNTVAIVMVEAVIPQFGAREGEALDVVVAAHGDAKSLAGGQLLMTPLQDATHTVPDIFAFTSGRIELPDSENPRRGLIRGGAVLEADFFYSFVVEDMITLVLDDQHAGFPAAQMVARAINHELLNRALPAGDAAETVVAGEADTAVATGPKNVRVRIPRYELAQPAGFISRVLETPLFALPEQPARVVINRTTRNVSFTGTVTISPTVLQVPGLGTVTIGARSESEGDDEAAPAPSPATKPVTPFQELLNTLASVKLPPDQVVAAIEHLHRTGTLHAQLIYTE